MNAFAKIFGRLAQMLAFVCEYTMDGVHQLVLWRWSVNFETGFVEQSDGYLQRFLYL